MTRKTFEQVNAPRIGQIVKIIDMIRRSGEANKATPEQIAALFAPLRDHMPVASVSITPPAPTVPQLPGTSPTVPQLPGTSPTVPQTRAMREPSWVSAAKFAETLDLKDLGHVIAVAMNRVSDALDENG